MEHRGNSASQPAELPGSDRLPISPYGMEELPRHFNPYLEDLEPYAPASAALASKNPYNSPNFTSDDYSLLPELRYTSSQDPTEPQERWTPIAAHQPSRSDPHVPTVAKVTITGPHTRMLASGLSSKGQGVGSSGQQTEEVNTAQVIESQAFAFEQVANRHISKNAFQLSANTLHRSHSFNIQSQAKQDQGLTQKLSMRDLEGDTRSDEKVLSGESRPGNYSVSVAFEHDRPDIAGEQPPYMMSAGIDQTQYNRSGNVVKRPPVAMRSELAEATYREGMYFESTESLWGRPSQWSPIESSRIQPQRPPQPAPYSRDEDPTLKARGSTGNEPARPVRRLSPQGCVEMCDHCNRIRDDVSFCPVCELHYCPEHWDGQLLHQRRIVKDGVPHERTDPRLAKRVKSIIEPSLTDDQQVQLHRADEDTTWFGVLPDPNGRPDQLLFHDFRRYESFMEQSTFNPKSVQFPSLVSFVGPTGAGKSTIVKALVKLSEGGNSKNENQTPVVGLTQNLAVPTSGEVHLYWNATLHTERPLMFADCEGIGGGSREPMAARATAISEKKHNPRNRLGKPQNRTGFDSKDVSPQYAMAGQSSKSPSHRISNFRAPTPSYTSMSPSNTPMPQATPSYYRQSFGPEYNNNSNRHSIRIEEALMDSGWVPGVNNNYRGLTHRIQWADSQTSRQFIVESLYPRILYTFSDVVVLVMRNAKQLEDEVQRLIRWGATAIEKSSNTPMLPFAIIVINAVDNRTDEELFDPGTATQRIFDDLRDTIQTNPQFATWASFWLEERNHFVDTTKNLLLSYYSDVEIVFIPEKGRPGLVWEQYQKLYGRIQDAVRRSQVRRRNAKLLLSAEQVDLYLQLAFNHFSTTLEEPFDFNHASSTITGEMTAQDNPVLALIIDYLSIYPQSDAGDIFLSIAPLVASSILLEILRQGLPGNRQAFFQERIEKVKRALDSFFDETWPCEARHPKLKERCIIVRTRHDTKGHQLANGKVWRGSYVSQKTGDWAFPRFQQNVLTVFRDLAKRLEAQSKRCGQLSVKAESEVAFKIHVELVVKKLCLFLRDPRFVTNRMCLCCLFRTPIYPLLCGHVVCDECFDLCAETVREQVRQLSWCPICLCRWERAKYEVVVKPKAAGVRVLSLDGGGVKSLIQLTTLRIIEDQIGLGIPIQAFFDLIIGTSGGGIVALAIGEQNISLIDAREVFKNFALKSFKERKGAALPLVGRLIQLRYQSRYESQGLESALKETFNQNLLFGGKRELQSPSICKVAVTTTDTNGEARLLANYNRRTSCQTPYHFQRFDKPRQELSTWEAARATSAAPSFFKSFYKVENGHTYQDGALKLNNPILAAHFEMLNIWDQNTQNAAPDMVLSISTGYFPDDKSVKHDPGPRYGIGLVDGMKNFFHIAKGAIREDLDCEKAWHEYMECLAPDFSDRRQRLHRLSIPFPGPKIELDAVDRMDELEARTKQYYANPRVFAQINEIAAQLIASLFYFERTNKIHMTIKGIIRCRLPQDVTQNGSLQKLAGGFKSHPHSWKGFRVFPDSKSNRWLNFPIRDEMLDRVHRFNDVFEVAMEFDLPDFNVITAIYFDLHRPGFGPQMISGFPRALVAQPLTPTPLTTKSQDPLSRLNSMKSAENPGELPALPLTPKLAPTETAANEPLSLRQKYKLSEWN